MRTRIWVIIGLIPVCALAQQRVLPSPQFVQPPLRFLQNRDSTSSEENLALPQPSLFLTSPAFSFDNVLPVTNTTQLPSKSLVSSSPFTKPARPQIRRPIVKPVDFVKLQNFRPTPRPRLPIQPRFQSTTSPFRPMTSPAFTRRVLGNSQARIRPRFQSQPLPMRRIPPPSPQRTPAIQVRPANVLPPSAQNFRRPQQPSVTQSTLRSRPTVQSNSTSSQPFSRVSQSSQALPSSPKFALTSRSRPTVSRFTPFLSSTTSQLATSTQRRPIPSVSPFINTNSVGPAAPPITQLPTRPSQTTSNVHPPGSLPPSNSVVDQLNRAEDFMAVAAQLKLRRFVRHRNRRRADFIFAQQMKNRS